MNYKHLVTCHDVLVPWNETPSQHTMTLSLWPRSQNPTERTQILWARGTTWRLFRGPPPGQSSLIHAIICHNETQREREGQGGRQRLASFDPMSSNLWKRDETLTGLPGRTRCLCSRFCPLWPCQRWCFQRTCWTTWLSFSIYKPCKFFNVRLQTGSL